MATSSDNSKDNTATTSKDTTPKEDNDGIFFFGDSSSSRKNEIIKTNVLGFPVQLDLLTAGIGGIALLGLGIAGYQLWMNTQKQQEEEARRRQVEQQKQARYLQYLKNQEMILKQQEAQKAELIEKQRMATPAHGQQLQHPNYGPISSYNNIDDPEMAYGDPNLHSGLSGLNLESDVDPYNKSSRLSNINRNYNPSPIDISYNEPPLLSNQRISAYNEQPQYIPPAPPVRTRPNNTQMIQPSDPGEQDMLPIEFSNPTTSIPPPSSNQPPQQRNRREVQHEQQQEEQQEREEGQDVSGEYDQGLSPNELMESINNSNYYN